jgi:membrane protein
MMKEVLMIPSVLPTVQLFLFLGAIVSLARLVMKYLTQQGSEAGKKPSIHLYYLIGIGALLLIELVTYILTGVGDVSRVIFDQISFASTISSILLSVIAIIYSIVSGSNGANLYVKTEEVSRQIGETLSDLGNLSTTVEKLEKIPDDIEKHLRELKEQMQRMEEVSKQTSQQLNQEVTPKIDILFRKVGGLVNGGDSSGARDLKGSRKERETIFRYYISRSSFYGGLVLLGCCYAGKKKEKIDLKEMTSKILGEESISILWYLLGYAIASSALGILNVEFDEEKMELRVKEVYNVEGFDLEKELLDFLNEVIGDKRSPEGLNSLREQQVKSIKSYFGIEEE